MVETNPLDAINDMLANDSDHEYQRCVTQEEELCSNPSDSEVKRRGGTLFQPIW
jgi:hypothetical protein